MKLLFDQNISPKIVRQVEAGFPDSKQVRHVGLEYDSDAIIFGYVKKDNKSYNNLNDPCKIEDPSWIKPTKYIGVWW